MSGAKNQVTLTFAGDSTQLERAFARVGDSAKSMSREVTTSANSFDRVAEAADTVDTRAMGFRDTLTGLEDGFKGLKGASSGDFGLQTLLLLGFGIGDLASGLFNFLIPGLKSMVTWLKAGNLATVAHTVATKAAAVGAKIWAAAQWLLNAALDANPVGLIIIAIAALVAIIVIIATKTRWFQNIWEAVWSFLKMVGAWFAGPFAGFFVNAWNTITGAFSAAWGWIRDTFTSAALWVHGKIQMIIDIFRAIPTAIRIAFSNVVDAIVSPFRAAFNMVARAWNATIGRLSWTVPSWVPGIGGHGFSAPRLPTFHTGGVVSGAFGREVVAVLQAGERVVATGAGGGGQVVTLQFAGDRAIVELVKRLVTVHGGGDVQVAFGRR